MQISDRAQKFLDTHCHMCNTAIKPKRQNKSGPRFCGNTCRQRAFRLKHKDWITEKPGTFGHLQEQLRRSQDLADDALERATTRLDECRRLSRDVDRLLTQVEDLREYNKGLQAQIKNQQLGATVDWEKLQGFDDQQLRNWVKVGARMARKNHPDPVNNATRHVEGNRSQLAAP